MCGETPVAAGTVINYGSGSDSQNVTYGSYGSGSGSDSTTLYCLQLFFSHPEAEDLIVRPVTAAGAAELTLEVWGDMCRGRNRN
jgi:hypothetical protein